MTTAAEKQALLRRKALETNPSLHPELRSLVADINAYLSGRAHTGFPTTTTTSTTTSTTSTTSSTTTTPMP